jgi:hypothetical protein
MAIPARPARLAPPQKPLAEARRPGLRFGRTVAAGVAHCFRMPAQGVASVALLGHTGAFGWLLFLGRVMSRFYEQYGFFIVWLFTAILGIALVYWGVVALATQGEILPSWINVPVLVTHNLVVLNTQRLARFVEVRIQWFGALATLGTFVFGLVTGIRQAKRQLPRRLVQFMNDVLQPVYDNGEALVNAVAYRSANVQHRAPLYLKAPLNYSLDALGGSWRPRKSRSLDESIKEADTYIEVTEKRLQYLKDIRSHAQILRGAVRSYDCIMRACDEKATANVDRCTETDFTEAIKNDTSKLAGLELRGLLRVRKRNLEGALEDFEALEVRAKELFNVRAHARALRLHSETLIEQVKQLSGKNVKLWVKARRDLDTADALFNGRTLDDEDRLERGRNRESCGLVYATMAAITGTGKQKAIQNFNSALNYYKHSKSATSADLARVHEQMARLQSP